MVEEISKSSDDKLNNANQTNQVSNEQKDSQENQQQQKEQENQEQQKLDLMPKHTYKAKRNILFQVINASFGAFLFGIFMSEYNAVQFTFHKMHGWTESQKQLYDGLITSGFPVGCFIGCFFGAWASSFGRRKAMIISDIISLIGIGITLIGPNNFPVATICVGRVLVGVMVGINCTCVNLYINEVTPKELSNSMGIYFQLFVNIGILAGLVIALGRPNNKEAEGAENNQFWRILFAVPFIPIIIRLIGLLCVYRFETPLFYYQKGNKELAKQELQKVYINEEEVNKQLQALDEKSKATKETSMIEMFSKTYLRRTICGMMLAAAQQLTGINAVVFFSTSIFAPDGIDSSQSDLNIAAYFSILVAVVLTLPQFIAGPILCRFGRKTILIFGQIAVILLLVILALLDFFVDDKYVKLVVILFYCFVFGLSAGPIVWFYVPEFCPPKGVGLSTLTNWFCCTIVGFTFQYIKEGLSLGGVFLLYAGISVAFFFYMMIFCVETKGRTPTEILEAFHGKQQSQAPRV